MAQRLSSLSSKGQVTIPQEIRRHLGLRPKDKVAFTIEGDVVTVRPARSPLTESYQAVPPLTRCLDPDEMIRIAAEEHASEIAREGL